MFIHKVDEDVSLRMFHEGDTEEFYHLIIDSKLYLREWLSWVDYIESAEDINKNIKARLKDFAENGGYPKSFAIMYKGSIAGTIGFNEINKNNKTGIVGYWLGESFQRNGIMTKTLNALLEYGFTGIGLNKIEIHVAVENKKSRTLPKRFGFVEEGKKRQAEWLYDHYVDHVMYGLLKSEWEEKCS